MNTTSDYHHSFNELLDLDECREAESLHAVVPDNLSPISLYQIGKCHYYEEQYDEAFSVFMSQWQNNRYYKTPLYLARSLINQQDFKGALRWLKEARKQPNPDNRIDYYYGVTFEGLGNKILAAKFYHLVMKDKDNDQYKNARKSLKRIENSIEK